MRPRDESAPSMVRTGKRERRLLVCLAGLLATVIGGWGWGGRARVWLLSVGWALVRVGLRDVGPEVGEGGVGAKAVSMDEQLLLLEGLLVTAGERRAFGRLRNANPL